MFHAEWPGSRSQRPMEMGCTYNEAQVRVTLVGGGVDAARSESIRMDPGASDAPICSLFFDDRPTSLPLPPPLELLP